MELTFTDEQEMLRQAVRDLMGRYSTPAQVRALEGDERGFDPELWRELAGMDLLGLLVPAEHGGSGRLLLEAAIVAEELGRALCPSPFVETAVLAPGLVGGEVAGGIARGETVVSLAWHEPDRTDGPEGIGLEASADRLSGEKILVPFASAADHLLTLARADGGIALYLVDPKDCELERMETLASDARFLVRFEGAPGRRLSGGWEAFVEAMDDALVAVAAYALGGAQRAHEISVEYAIERRQFDRPIGAFQGIAHPLADMATEIEGARTLLWQAVWARTEGRSGEALAAMAKLNACDVFRRATKVGHQVFGGIGFTLDIDIQLFLRRAKQLEVLWFGPAYLAERVAAAELDEPEPLVTADPVASAASD